MLNNKIRNILKNDIKKLYNNLLPSIEINAMSKYKKLTDQDIEKGIKSGQLREEGVLVRNTSNGETVKVIKEASHSKQLLPPTFIQVNNITIYQADLSRVFEEIIKNRNLILLSDLEEKYSIILDLFNSYLTYGKYLDDLLKECLKTAVSFEKRIDILVNEIDTKAPNSDGVNRVLNVANAYVRTLLIYILALFLCHKGDFEKDSVILDKINHLEDCLKNVYEQLLAPSKYDEEKDVNIFYMDNSIYAQYLFNEDFSILDLDCIIEHDRRFKSSLELINFFKRFHKKDNVNHNNYYTSSSQKIESQINASYLKVDKNNNFAQLVDGLKNIFIEISQLKTYRQEIANVGSDEEAFKLVKIGISFSNKQIA